MQLSAVWHRLIELTPGMTFDDEPYLSNISNGIASSDTLHLSGEDMPSCVVPATMGFAALALHLHNFLIPAKQLMPPHVHSRLPAQLAHLGCM